MWIVGVNTYSIYTEADDQGVLFTTSNSTGPFTGIIDRQSIRDAWNMMPTIPPLSSSYERLTGRGGRAIVSITMGYLRDILQIPDDIEIRTITHNLPYDTLDIHLSGRGIPFTVVDYSQAPIFHNISDLLPIPSGV